jgi:hypothetical protein
MHRTVPRWPALALLLACVSGCAFGIGVKIPPKSVLPRPVVFASWPVERPAPDTLAFGRATRADIKKLYGDPLPDPGLGEDQLLVLPYNVKFDWKFNKGVHAGTEFPGNGQVFLFEDDVLVGEAYYSSFEADHTDFDETKVVSIVKGQTTRDQVLALIGQPSGRRLCPADALDNPTGLEYLYLSRRRHMGLSSRTWIKWLSVQFDANGIVCDVRLRTRDVGPIRLKSDAGTAAEPVDATTELGQQAADAPPLAG